MANCSTDTPEPAIASDAVGDWQRRLAGEPTTANLHGVMRAVRERRAFDAEEEEINAERRREWGRRHLLDAAVEQARDETGSTDDTRAVNMSDLLKRYDELFPVRGVTLDEIEKRHAWRQLDPTRKRWRVAGLLRGRGVTLLSADPKCGKSTFARCLAVAVAAGEQVFCGRAIEQSPTLFIELDESGETADEHFAEIFIPGAPLRVHYDYGGGLLPPRLADRFAWLTNWAQDERAGIIVIDTLARFTPPAGNNGISDYAITTPMSLYQRLTESTGAHVVVLHHLAKGSDGARTPLGSQAIAGAVDSLWTMTKRDDGEQRYLEISGRRVTLPKTEIVHEHGWVTFGETVHGRELAAVDSDILDWVAAQPAPVTKNDICKAVKGQKSRLLTQIGRLADAGKLRRVGVVPGGRNQYGHERFEYPHNSAG